MKRWHRSLVVAFVTALVGCQWPSAREDAEKRALEQRVAELETRLQATASPSPESTSVEPSPGPASESARDMDVDQSPQPRATAAPAAPERTAGPEPAAAQAPEAGTASVPVQKEKRDVVVGEWALKDGCELTLVIETPLSTRSSKAGDPVVTRVERAVDAQDRVCAPSGSTLSGRVTRVKGAARVGGKASLAFAFDRLVAHGRRQSIEPFSVELQGASDLKRDGALVAGGALAGAMLGGVIDGGKGAKKGAAVGAVGGAGAAVATKGETIELPAGRKLIVTVTRTAQARR